ncbi:hypothetical protein SYNPS1DRAFT_25622 [Syncephalis pseudoplumigaleata]|uniref:Uncharacterized protein n=1 Tax=Syncephalis pseudoplumigaleata TaxID=1712513 RepID=A0A4V1J0S6_9FUNG|nr:hypothetical protein SYNPS1DRAFT_25622 [Syncephalis pseudoplumigaleata]|eukprot:RKP22589.1 hypothetical protein SYNPS1DRAFT_25622 [Syncephalis pseudoplumigaleata]
MTRTNSDTVAADGANGLVRRATTNIDRRRSSVMSAAGISAALPFHQFQGREAARAPATTSIAPVTTPVTVLPERSKSMSLRGAAGVLRAQPRAPTTPRHGHSASLFSRSPPARIDGVGSEYGHAAAAAAAAAAAGKPNGRVGFTSKFMVQHGSSYPSLSTDAFSTRSTASTGQPGRHGARPTGPAEGQAPSSGYPATTRISTSPGAIMTERQAPATRQHFLADDEQYLLHPRNQLRLTKELERVRRSLLGVRRSGDNPIWQSVARVSAARRQQQQRQLEEASFARMEENGGGSGVTIADGQSV